MDIQANDMDRISENPDLTLVQTPGVGVTIGRINTLKEPLTDPRVRLALIKALDVDAAVEAVYGRKGPSAPGTAPPPPSGATTTPTPRRTTPTTSRLPSSS